MASMFYKFRPTAAGGDNVKITIEVDPKEIADLRALALREDRLIDSKIVNAVIAKVTKAVKKSATYRTTRELCFGIEGYSTHTTPQKNVMTVDFAIIGTAMEPKDYQAILDRLQTFCEEFTPAAGGDNVNDALGSQSRRRKSKSPARAHFGGMQAARLHPPRI